MGSLGVIRRGAALAVAGLVLLLAGAARAQDEVSITGTVVTASGTPARGAEVRLAHLESGLEARLITDNAGRFEARGIPSGAYLALAQAGDVATQFWILAADGEQGAPSRTLWVSPLILRPGDAGVAGVRRRNALDLAGRMSELTRGTEGGELEGFGPYSAGENNGVNSFGQRSQSNDFRLDGADNNEPWLRGPALALSAAATETVSLAAGYVPAGSGQGAGAVVRARTRSGGAEWHGRAFEDLGHSAMTSRNFFDGATKPGLKRSLFGGGIGGPLVRRSWFIFGGMELLRERRGLTLISTVPTDSQRLGSFGTRTIFDPLTIREARPVEFLRQPFPGNRIPEDRIPAASRRLALLYPAPNLPGLFHNYRHTPRNKVDSERADLRTDKMLGERGLITGRFSGARDRLDSPSVFGGATASDAFQRANAALTLRSVWSGAAAVQWQNGPAMVQTVRASLTATRMASEAADAGTNSAEALAIPGLGLSGSPSVRPTGYTQLGAAAPAPFRLASAGFELSYGAVRRTRRHLWQFGAQALRRHANGEVSEWPIRGTFLFTPDYTSQPGVDGTGDAFASLLTGYPAEVRRDTQFEPFRLRGWECSGFLQDRFRLGRLTIEAGLRYSLRPPLTEASGRMVNLNHNREALGADWYAGRAGVNRYAGAGYNRRAVAPRIGFALDLSRGGATVLRGGFSQMYDAGAYVYLGILARNLPFGARQDLFAGSLQVGPSLQAGIPAPASIPLPDATAMNRAGVSVFAIEPSGFSPYADQWELRIERRLRTDLVADIGGMGSMGMHLHSMLNANQPYPAPTPYEWRRHPYDPYLGRIEYLGMGGGSTFYGGQMRLAGLVTRAIHLEAAYRYAKAIDDAAPPMANQRSRPAGAQYIYHPRSMRAASSFDITQRLTLTAVHELPSVRTRAKAGLPGKAGAVLGGWRAFWTLTAQTGLPFTPELAVNGLNNGGFWLPKRVGIGTLAPPARSAERWFNASLDKGDPEHAFETPTLYQYGNSGYNILRGPGMILLDAALGRGFRIGEKLEAQMRMEAWNLLNHTNLALPNRILGLESSGAISHTATPARQVRVGMSLAW